MRKILKNTTVILFVAIILFILSGCQKNNIDTELSEKILNEIEYLDSKIVSMLNSINGISYQNYKVSTEKIELDKNSGGAGEQTSTSQKDGQKDKEEQGESQSNSEKKQTINKSEMQYSSLLNTESTETNWDLIKSDMEILHSTWNTIVIDLNKKTINEEDISSFGKELDSATISIKDENKEESLEKLAKMYSFLPKLLENNDETSKNIKNVKMHVINAYSLAEKNNWNDISAEINQAIINFDAMMSNKQYIDQNTFNIEKTKVELKELQNAADLKDKQIFYIKYRNLMEQLGTL